MGRKPKFSREAILQCAAELAARGGPAAVTLHELARTTGAPVGSIYHRFSGRDALLGELWLNAAEHFQRWFVGALAEVSHDDDAIAMARELLAFTRRHTVEASLLTVHRRADFLEDCWPAELAARAARLEPQIRDALVGYSRRRFGRSDARLLARVRFALVDVPLAAVKPYLQRGKSPPKVLDELVGAALGAILAAPLTGRSFSV